MDAIIDKLQTLGELPAADQLLLKTVLSDVRSVAARKDILREGDRPTHIHLVVSGWCCRYNIVSEGARQITAFLLPGDLCNSHITLLRRMDHGVGTLTPVKIAYIAPSEMDELLARPLIARALWLAGLVDESALRAWTVSLGKRNASERVAHLICELFVRLGTTGSARADGFDFPLTQEQLGDALGLTPVHVNRVVRHLREAGLMSIRNRTVEIADFPKLQKMASFDPGYLQPIG
jgi:CRP-like cAMP-binding protein